MTPDAIRFRWAVQLGPRSPAKQQRRQLLRRAPDIGLFVVADGMGGHVAGEVASRVAVEAIQAFIDETAGADKNRTWPFPFDPALSLEANRLKAAFRLANRHIAAAMADSQDLRGMATTASAVLAGHDARLRRRTSATAASTCCATAQLAQITARSLLGRGAGPRRHADARARRASIPWRNVVTRALSGGEDPEVDVDRARRRAGRALSSSAPTACSRVVADDADRARSSADTDVPLDGDLPAARSTRPTRRAARTTSRRSFSKSMLHNLARLLRYRGLIQSLVARELKARYRGSVLGFFWSFINPLLLLLVYSFVFTFVMPAAHDQRIEPYALFMFCGILPWTWFSSSLTESAGVLISGGNLIKKVLFPAEILPIVTVLANMVHFFLGLPILAGSWSTTSAPLTPASSLWFPLVVLVQLVLTLGFALILSALTVHFRDIRDILSNLLTFWFFATPIIYPYFLFEDRRPGTSGRRRS